MRNREQGEGLGPLPDAAPEINELRQIAAASRALYEQHSTSPDESSIHMTRPECAKGCDPCRLACALYYAFWTDAERELHELGEVATAPILAHAGVIYVGMIGNA